MGRHRATGLVGLFALVVATVGVVASASVAQAAVFDDVDTEAELRAAIATAAGDLAADTINLTGDVTLAACAPEGHFEELPDTGDLDHEDAGDLTINGNGHRIIQTCPGARVLSHRNSGALTLNGVTITGGDLVVDDGIAWGGGVYSGGSGPVTVFGSIFTLNTASSKTGVPDPDGGAKGGALYVDSVLTVDASIFSLNAAIGLDGDPGGPGLAGEPGTGALGGAIFSTAPVTVTGSDFSANGVFGGAGGAGGDGDDAAAGSGLPGDPGGAGGDGGNGAAAGIAAGPTSPVSVSTTAFANNVANGGAGGNGGNGGNGGDASTTGGGAGGAGGAAGDGGGGTIADVGSTDAAVDLSEVTSEGATANGGPGGAGGAGGLGAGSTDLGEINGPGGAGGAGGAGGVAAATAIGDPVTADAVAISNVTLNGGGGGAGGAGGDSAEGPPDNISGDGGAGGAGGDGGVAFGVVVSNDAAPASITGFTATGIAQNAGAGGPGGAGGTAGSGADDGVGGDGGDGGEAIGAPIFIATSTVSAAMVSGVSAIAGAGGTGGGSGFAPGAGGAGGVAAAAAAVVTGPTDFFDTSFDSLDASSGAGGVGGANLDAGPGGPGGPGGSIGEGIPFFPTGVGIASIDTVSMTRSSVTNVVGTAGPGGAGGAGATQGDGGAGGGNDGTGVVHAPTLDLVNTTVSANTTAGGPGGAGGTPGVDGESAGSGVTGGAVGLTYATIVGNTTDVKAANLTSTTLSSDASVVALPGGGDANCGIDSSLSTNSIESGTDCAFEDASDTQGASAGDLAFGPLGLVGVNQTFGHVPGAGSIALDAIAAPCAGLPAEDQRSLARPQPAAGACDIGAVEGESPAVPPTSSGATADPVVALKPLGSGKSSHVVTVSATIDDSSTPETPIVSGSVTLSTSAKSAHVSPVTAADGAFDEAVEVVQATIDTTTMLNGAHTACLTGTDSDGNTSPEACVTFYVQNGFDGTASRGVTSSCPAGTFAQSGFADADGLVHTPSIYCLANLWEIVKGFNTTPPTYGPALSTTRAQVATLLANVATAAGVALPANPPDAFVDDNGNVHEGNINALVAAKVIKGKTATTYAPNDPVTRAQFASLAAQLYTFITARTLDPAGANIFTDDNGNVHEGNINGLAANGVVVGKGGGLFAPADPITRAQIATLLAQLLDMLVDEAVTAPPS